MDLECHTVYLLLGSNLGNKIAHLQEAMALLAERVGEISALSSIYQTAAWGKEDQPAFLNMAIKIRTSLSPLEVLEDALAIEKLMGRVRKEHWGQRLIDIDLLLFGDEIIDEGIKLQVPHPQMQFRNFVLVPLSEIAGGVIHPVLKLSIDDLRKQCKDPLPAYKL
ncbi:2-amino-4-hydroxy-6-hydroxymethyldihydropteridine diphosphokinase [Pedobacter sp. UYP30]|uniref:2-amino-4-hydroxy-6- hydroxymethyldihydropteridine diphosphokinase n=1 Tax=Pedobacter sp. UYP30 TaxID=1756400 RepID=UPI00339314F0